MRFTAFSVPIIALAFAGTVRIDSMYSYVRPHQLPLFILFC